MIVALSKSENKQEKAISARQTAYVDSGVTDHMAMDDTVLSMKMKLSSGSIGTASGEVVRVKSEWTYEFQLSSG